MKKLMTIFGAILFASFILTSCNNNNVANGTKKTVGDWYHEVSRNMGGFQISSNTKLSIHRNGPGDYDYTLSTTIVDQMYGGQPKTENSTGKLDGVIQDGKWKFITGDFGNRGAYFVVPSDKWENDNPTEITIQFASGSGNPMTFKR